MNHPEAAASLDRQILKAFRRSHFLPLECRLLLRRVDAIALANETILIRSSHSVGVALLGFSDALSTLAAKAGCCRVVLAIAPTGTGGWLLWSVDAGRSPPPT